MSTLDVISVWWPEAEKRLQMKENDLSVKIECVLEEMWWLNNKKKKH